MFVAADWSSLQVTHMGTIFKCKGRVRLVASQVKMSDKNKFESDAQKRKVLREKELHGKNFLKRLVLINDHVCVDKAYDREFEPWVT